MIDTLFERENGFVVPRVNPDAAWVFDEVSMAVSTTDYNIQLSDINILDIHELNVIDAYRVLRDALAWIPEDGVVFLGLFDEGGKIAQLKRADFNYDD